MLMKLIVFWKRKDTEQKRLIQHLIQLWCSLSQYVSFSVWLIKLGVYFLLCVSDIKAKLSLLLKSLDQ